MDYGSAPYRKGGAMGGPREKRLNCPLEGTARAEGVSLRPGGAYGGDYRLATVTSYRERKRSEASRLSTT